MSLEQQNNRLESLELKTMDLENTVQELHEVLLRQYQDIDKLQRQLTRLNSRLENSGTDTPTPSPSDELPPHY